MFNRTIQADERSKELTASLVFLAQEARIAKYEYSEAMKLMEREKLKADAARARYDQAVDVLNRLADGADGLYEWGLPATITVEEFLRLVPLSKVKDVVDTIGRRTKSSGGSNGKD